MLYSSQTLEKVITEFSKLPGIGRKTAQRLVFHLLKVPKEEVLALADALLKLKEKTRFCSVCFNITEKEICDFCANENRDPTIICVVEEPNDVLALEKTGHYKGLYHVLGGSLSPLEGIGPDDLKIEELMKRLNPEVKEIIIATNPDAEGETTSLYLAKLLKARNVKVTRIAQGIPAGGDLEYADDITLTRALDGRTIL